MFPCTSLPSTTNDYAAACWLVHAQLPSHDGEGHSDLESEEILNLATRKIQMGVLWGTYLFANWIEFFKSQFLIVHKCLPSLHLP